MNNLILKFASSISADFSSLLSRYFFFILSFNGIESRCDILYLYCYFLRYDLYHIYKKTKLVCIKSYHFPWIMLKFGDQENKGTIFSKLPTIFIPVHRLRYFRGKWQEN